MQCNQKNDEKKEKYQLWIWFCSNNTKFSKLRNLSRNVWQTEQRIYNCILGGEGGVEV